MRPVASEATSHPVLIFWIAAGWVGFLILPWYGIEGGIFSLEWLVEGYPFDTDFAPAAFLIGQGEKLWLVPLIPPLIAPWFVARRPKTDPLYAKVLILSGAFGFGWLIAQGFGIGIRGWSFGWLEALFGPLDDRQFGMGYGAMLLAASFLFVFTQGIAARGAINGDVFVVSAIGGVIAIVATFVFFPIAKMLTAAFVTEDGGYSFGIFAGKFFDDRLWGLDCLITGGRCGVAWNSLFLAILVGVLTTALGLVFALVVTRSGFRYKRLVRALTVLPIITPPFVIGLALILLFGLSGTVTVFVADVFGVQPTRWLYGLPGILIAQVLAFTPIAFLVLIGVVEGVSPSMEEAAQTLRANRWQVFRTVTLPLIRPGLANAFLLGFIESMADFGNPLVLGGNYDVLSTEIFFAIVGAQYDQGRAAVLALVLLGFTLGAFYAQRFWLGKKSYTTVSGKGDAGVHPLMPRRLNIPVYAIAGFWGTFTIVVYGMILYGSVVELWGVNNTLTFKHYVTAFSVRLDAEGIRWTGSAWDSFWTTIKISAIAAPLTAAVGLVTAYLLTRQTFRRQERLRIRHDAVFRHPRHGDRRQLHPRLQRAPDRADRHRSDPRHQLHLPQHAGRRARRDRVDVAARQVARRILADARRQQLADVPQGDPAALRPAILAALVYSFVRAMTAISAVIFLVSAQYDMATSYIIGRVENNDYGLAIAYSTALIFVMLGAVGLLQLLVGKTRIGRRTHVKVGG